MTHPSPWRLLYCLLYFFSLPARLSGLFFLLTFLLFFSSLSFSSGPFLYVCLFFITDSPDESIEVPNVLGSIVVFSLFIVCE